ncbi:MAG: hypothetical protein ABH817_02375 [archaeon]
MNKRGQFLIIFAVIFGILILSISTQFNFSQNKNSKVNQLIFNGICENYKTEVFRLSLEDNAKDKIDAFKIKFAQETNEFKLTITDPKYRDKNGHPKVDIYLETKKDGETYICQ